MGPMVGVAKLEQQFEERYADRSIPGWQESTHKEKLFCLPTSKLLKSEATRKSHMTGQLYKKRLGEVQKMGFEEQKKLVEAVEAEDKRIARLESHAAKWHDLLSDTIQETVQHLQKKQSQTVEEMEAEKDDDSDDGVDVDDGGVDVDPDEMQDDEDRPIYNPLNLPLGWASSTSARSVATTRTGVDEHSSAISRSGDTHSACGASGLRTPRISRRSQRSRTRSHFTRS